jgi:hypothetical protein
MNSSLGVRSLIGALCAFALAAATGCGRGVGGSVSPTSLAQSATPTSRGAGDATLSQGLPYDWSHRRLIFSRPHSAAIAQRLEREPRYRMQQAWRARPALMGAVDAYMHLLDARAVELAASAQWSAKSARAQPRRRLTGDWSVNLGSGATVGADRFPAKYSFNANSTPSCTNDFVAFNTGRPGSPSQASVIAFNNLYPGATACGTSGVPAVYWSYNTGGTVLNSVVLSGDGTQLAFIHSSTSGAVASLVVLKWKAGQGTSAGAPASPNTITSTPSTFVTCKSNPANSCELTLSFANNNGDALSSPFYDYANDIIYVGDDFGVVHKFAGVFKGTPGEVLTSPWPVTVHPGVFLNSPVLDAGAATPMLYVAESTNPAGSIGSSLDYINVSTGLNVRSANLGRNSIDITDGPIVDSSAGKIYVAVGNDSGQHSGVFVFSRNFSANSSGTEAAVGAGSVFTAIPIYDGSFDNNYFNSSNGTGNLYICGNTGGNPTLYQVPVTATGFGAVHAGPSVAGANVACSPVTEVYNTNAPSGPFDWIFLSVQGSGSLSNCASSGCAMNFIVTQWQANTAYSSNREILDANLNIQKVTTAGTSGSTQPVWKTASGATTTDGSVVWTNQGSMSAVAASRSEPGGTSGIIIDNTSASTGASQVYFSTLANGPCATSGGTGGCAVQASQSGLSQ